ncbi:MAG TPA: hypothetical protein PK268_00650 [Enterococcus sp.]|nr:hypothetical protein [Enterococcus sp.]HPR80419.1 hypothetical protein [Enterococcus sp.]
MENRLSTSNSTVKKATTDILFVVAFFCVYLCFFSGSSGEIAEAVCSGT